MKKFCMFFLLSFLFTTVKSQVGEFIWQENFDELNIDRWTIVTGDGCDLGEGMCGWGNQELQYYKTDNVYIEEIPGEPGNNALVIEARNEAMGSSSFTSGRIETKEKLAVRYGMIEVRMKVPDLNLGLWPAAWLLGTTHDSDGWPYCGEIDMMEMGQKLAARSENGHGDVTVNEYVGANLIWYSEDAVSSENPLGAASIASDHYYNQPYVPELEPLNDRFVKYRLYWDDSNIRLTVVDDGIENDLYTGPFPLSGETGAFTKPFYFILNLAVGGNFTDVTDAEGVTAPLPAKMYVDYIHVRKWNGKGEIIDANVLSANAGNDQIVADGETVVLNGSASFGPITEYEWSINGEVVATTETADVNLATGFYTAVLSITDADGRVSTDEITIRVGNPTEEIGEVIWEEQFDSFNSDVWNIVIGNGCEFGENMCGWGNFELEYYDTDNVYIAPVPGESGNNALVLEARRESIGNSSFTSGKIDTKNKLAIKYGVVEVRMMVPDLKTGLWPAAWLLGVNNETAGWPACGEMDMMEMGQSQAEKERQGFAGADVNNYVGANLIWKDKAACSGENAVCAASMAWDPWFNQPYVSGTPLSGRFVTYRMYWNEAKVIYTVVDNGVETELYADDIPLLSTPELASTFQKPFYFILNFAVGGNFTDVVEDDQVTAPFPAKMYVDYVKVMKWNGKGEVISGSEGFYVEAGSTQEVIDEDKDGKELVLLDASASYGDIVDYQWSQNGVVLGTGVTAEIELATGTHSITLTATDSKGNVKTDGVDVQVREIIWEDQFDTLNEDIWNLVEGDGCDLGEGMCGWGNQELQYYHASNVSTGEMPGELGNVALVLEARQEVMGNSSFTSGRVDTKNKVAIKYGIIEVRMQVPDLEIGLWPAAWLLGINDDEVSWPSCGEIDMMEMGHKQETRTFNGFDDATENEYVGANLIWFSEEALTPENPSGAASIAFDPYYNNPYVLSHNPMNDRPMTYRLYWSPSEIRFTAIDNGAEVDLYTGPQPINGELSAFQNPFYFILNLAVGGNFTDATSDAQVTAPMPAKMYVDYVRVMKWNGYGAVTFGEDRIFADAGADKIVNIGSKVYLDGSGSSSMGGDIESYVWSVNGQQFAVGQTTAVDLSPGIHTVVLEVTDDLGNMDTDEVVITVGDVDVLIANAGDDRTVDVADVVILDGSGSSDPDNNIVSYTWLLDGQEIGTGVNPDVTNYLSMGINTITLVVENGNGDQAMDIVTITVVDAGMPVADAGDNQSVSVQEENLPVLISLDGSGSYDPDGSIVEYSWADYTGEIATAPNTQVMLNPGRHVFTLTITDDDGKTDSDEVVVEVEKEIGGGNLILTPDCVDDFTVEVSSDKTNPTLTFIPNGEGIGNSVLYLFYSTDQTQFPSVPANNATPNEPFQIQASEGEVIYFSYTFNTPVGEKNTLNCLLSFEVGSSSVVVVNPPVADAGDDLVVEDVDDNGVETVMLDGSGSTGTDGAITGYSWWLNGSEIATGVNPSVELPLGIHEIYLKVEDENGSIGTDVVSIEVSNDIYSGIVIENAEELHIFSNGERAFIETNVSVNGILRIIGISGQMVFNQNVSLTPGVNKVPYDFNSGVYVLWLNTGNNNFGEKVIIF